MDLPRAIKEKKAPSQSMERNTYLVVSIALRPISRDGVIRTQLMPMTLPLLFQISP